MSEEVDMDKKFNTITISRQNILDAYEINDKNKKVKAILQDMSDVDMKTFIYNYYVEAMFKTFYEELADSFNEYMEKEFCSSAYK